MAHGIFISENCSYTKDGSKIRSALNPVAALDNGSVVTLSGLVAGEREVWTAAVGTVSTAKADVWIVTTPEVDYVETPYKTIKDFYNGVNDSADKKVPMRVVKLEKGDIFGLTIEVLSEAPTAAKPGIQPAADGKWTVAAADADDFAKYIGTSVDAASGTTYYSFEAL